MSGARSLGRGVALAAASAVTSVLALHSWRGFTEAPDGWLWSLLAVGLVLGVLGAVLRWARVPAVLVAMLQLLAAGGYASLALTGSLVPTGEAWLRLGEVLTDAQGTIQGFRPPVPAAEPTIVPVLLLCGLGVVLSVDVLAGGVRRVPLAGLPLMTAYTVAVSLLGSGVSWWSFVLGATGFLVMLYLDQQEALGRWGRSLGQGEDEPSALGLGSRALRTTATGVAAASTVLAVVLAAVIPTFSLSVFPGGTGTGGDVRIENPMVDLRRDLLRGADIDLVTVRTDDPDPSYLRLGVLTTFEENEWKPGNRAIPAGNSSRRALPPPAGVSPAITRTPYSYELSATGELDSRWLPTYEMLTGIDAPGSWRYDDTTRDFTSLEHTETTAGLSWELTAEDLRYDVESMREASTAIGVDDLYTELPDDYPAEAVELAREVTRDATSPFDRALTLQQWFREDGGFEYDDSQDPGSGTDDLVRFLAQGPEGRRGYCEQFAAAMAAMGRSLGIPSRVVVGFLQPTRSAPRTWVFSAHDMHAWTELYIPGSGWVRFEPTPAQQAEEVPWYTREGVQAPNPEPTSTATAEPSADPSVAGPQRPQPGEGGGDESSGGGAGVGRYLLYGVLGLLLAASLLCVPLVVRRARRARRARATDPEQAWAELRDTAVDLGLPWPQDASVRVLDSLLAGHLAAPGGDEARPRTGPDADPPAAAALHRVAMAVERARYARPGGDVPDLHEDVATVVRSWRAGVSPTVRRRADWWPRSVLRPTRVVPAPRQPDRDLVDSVR